MNLPKEYISYNQIRQYQTCPKKYHYSYIENLRLPINEKVFLGTVVHSVIEYTLKQKIAGQSPGNDEIIETFHQQFDEIQQEKEICWGTSPAKNRERGLSFINYFIKEMTDQINPLMVEKELEVDIPRLKVKLKGIIDLVEKDFSLTDFKTTTSRWSKDRAKSQFLQMVIYKHLFEKTYQNIGSELKLVVIYSKNKSGVRHQQFAIKSADADMEKMFTIIKYVTENISKGIFYKNQSYACNFCDFKTLCLGSG
jgi:RecB family exonuclease